MSRELPTQSRRQFLTTLAVGGAFLAGRSEAAPREPVVVMTNHNDDAFSLFEEAFEKAQRRYRLKIAWSMPREARILLRRDEGFCPDVWWQAAPRNHLADLAKEGKLLKLSASAEGLPKTIAGFPLADKDGYFRATQLTAFGFLANRKAIVEQGLPWPADWPILARPEYMDKVAIADFSRQFHGHIALEIVLRSFGWANGWALISAILGNAVLLSGGLADEVSSGRQPVALHVDILPNAEQRYRRPLERIYPQHGGIMNAGYIGVPRRSANLPGANAFIEFVLSDEGQALLPDTDLPRLPVRPTSYARLPPEQFNPFDSAAKGEFHYFPEAEPLRGRPLSAMFGAMVKDHARLAALWRRYHAAAARTDHSHPALEQARQTLGRAPASEDEVAHAGVAFIGASSEEDANAWEALRERLATICERDRAVAERLLQEAGA